MALTFPALCSTDTSRRRFLARAWRLLHVEWRRRQKEMKPADFEKWRTTEFIRALNRLTAARDALRDDRLSDVWCGERAAGSVDTTWDRDIDLGSLTRGD